MTSSLNGSTSKDQLGITNLRKVFWLHGHSTRAFGWLYEERQKSIENWQSGQILSGVSCKREKMNKTGLEGDLLVLHKFSWKLSTVIEVECKGCQTFASFDPKESRFILQFQATKRTVSTTHGEGSKDSPWISLDELMTWRFSCLKIIYNSYNWRLKLVRLQFKERPVCNLKDLFLSESHSQLEASHHTSQVMILFKFVLKTTSTEACILGKS